MGNKIECNYITQNKVLEKVQHVKDLAVIIDTELSLVPHIQHVCDKAIRMFALIQLVRNKGRVHSNTVPTTLIRSKLECGSVICSSSAKICLGLSKKSFYYVFGE